MTTSKAITDEVLELECGRCGATFYSYDDLPTCGACDYEPEPAQQSTCKDGRTKEYGEKYHSRHGKDFRKARRVVLDRDGYECVYCGLTDDEHRRRDDLFGKGLHVHHITPTTSGGSHDPDNLETVCADCHFKVEHGYMGE